MPLPTTAVTFPSGAVRGRSTVLAARPLPDGRFGVVTEETPFHPVDHTWPDQPADTGTLAGAAVVDALTAATPAAPEGEPELLVGADIPVRRGDPEWHWHVLHVVEEDPSALVSTEVELAVDAERRAAFCAGHTGCHLLALALNAALSARWRKEAATDSLGNPDFDALAITSSRITEGGSVDVYRLGKSLRKKGFTSEGLADELPALADAANTSLAGWIASAAPVRVRVPGPELTARREWSCALPEATVSIPCGGTHLGSLSELSALTTSLSLNEDGTELTARTTAVRG